MNIFLYFIISFLQIHFKKLKLKKRREKYVSSDDAKIKALQNQKDILPSKRKIKPRIYDSYCETKSSDIDPIDSIPGIFFVFR